MAGIISVVPNVMFLLRTYQPLKDILGDNDEDNPKIVPEDDNDFKGNIFPLITYEETLNTPTYFANNIPIEFQIQITIRIYTTNPIEYDASSNTEDIESIKSIVDEAMTRGTFILNSSDGGPIFLDGKSDIQKRLFEKTMIYELLDVNYFKDKFKED